MYSHMIWILLFNFFIGACWSICSPLYGRQPCSFLPAPPGKTPHCARPGQTYCEHPEHYPGELIHHLIQEWRYDHSTILSDESKDDFGGYFYPPPTPVYGPPNYRPPNQEPTYTKPFHGPNNAYIPPKFKAAANFSAGGGFAGMTNYLYQQPPREGQFYTYKYSATQETHRPSYYHQAQNYYTGIGQPQVSHYANEIWKRRVEQKYGRLKRSLRYKRSLLYSNSTLSHLLRRKRQSTSVSGDTLCQTRSQYIMPRAALNNKGNWMYVVNMPEVDSSFTQLVKSETCASQTCSGICSLPQGYTSRCEQKYVQKRLVALEGGGNQLYTDVFWFPSCCVCTLSNT